MQTRYKQCVMEGDTVICSDSEGDCTNTYGVEVCCSIPQDDGMSGLWWEEKEGCEKSLVSGHVHRRASVKNHATQRCGREEVVWSSSSSEYMRSKRI